MPSDPKNPPVQISTKPSMPAQPTTKAIPAMTDRALLEDIVIRTKDTQGEIRSVRGDLDLLIGDVSSLKVDVRELQRWKIHSDERQEKHSGGVRGLSENDAGHDAAIAHIITELGATKLISQDAHDKAVSIETKMDQQTAILTRLDGIVKDPKVRFVGKVLWGAAMMYAAARGLKVLP
jgi:hypothetical protein